MREVPRIGTVFFVCVVGVRPVSTFGLRLNSKPESEEGWYLQLFDEFGRAAEI